MHGRRAFSSLGILLAVGGCTRPLSRPEVPAEPQVIIEVTSAVSRSESQDSQVFAAPQSQSIAAPDPDDGIPGLEQVKSVLYRPGCGSNRFVGERTDNELMIDRWGARAFPAYEAILTDPTSDVVDVEGVCIALHQLKIERSRFIPPLVNRLIAPDALVQTGVTRAWDCEFDEGIAHLHRNGIRRVAIELLGEIGSEQETAHIRPYLHDNDYSVQYAVLTTLSKIGGKSDLDAVNVWLCNPWPLRPEGFIRRVKQCRDKVEARLKGTNTRALDGTKL